jgi:glutamate dehydrogenase/leucine dehydrogenase
VVADIDESRVARATQHANVEAIGVHEIVSADVDILSPNALGAVLSDESIPTIRAKVVCGGANNQLAHDEDAKLLADHGIFYAPDYVVNAGGIINIYGELDPGGWDDEVAHRRADHIADTLAELFELATSDGITTEEAAERIAERRMSVRTGPDRWWHAGRKDDSGGQ